MKVLIRNFDSVALYADDSLLLTAQGLTGDDWRDSNFTTANAQLIDATPPAGWMGAEWSYIAGVWTLVAVTAKAARTAAERAVIWEAIKALRDRKTQAGGYTVLGKWYHSDLFSRTQQIGLVLMGAGVPVGLQWKTMDGSFVTMTQVLAAQVFAAAAANDQALFARAEALRTEVFAASDPATVNINAGWPASFQG